MENSTLLVTLVVLMGILVLTQVVTMLGIWLSLRKMASVVEQQLTSFDGKITPVLAEVKERLDQAKDIFESAQKAAENFVSVSAIIKTQAERVNVTLEETNERARIQIAKADEVISDVVEKIHITAVIVQQNILAPVREISAIIRGVSSALQILFGRRRNPVDRVHQDEELFI